MTEQTQQRIVVLGGGYAGVMAALQAAARTKGKGVTVTLIDAKPAFSERIRLHQLAAGERTRQRAYAGVLRGTGARFEQGRALDIDLAAHSVALETPAGRRAIGYDMLVYALGSHTDRDAVPGVRENAFTLDFGVAEQLRSRLAALPSGSSVVVCGGGLTGIETATEIAESHPGLRVTLAERGGFGAAFSAKGREHLLKRFANLGIDVRDATSVREVLPDRVLTNAGDLPCDLCIWAGSFVASPLAREAGLAINARGQILTDATLRSRSHPEVLAAGDAAAPETLPLRMACATAMPLGTQAGDNAAAIALGKELAPMRFAYAIWCISLGRRDGLVQFVDQHDAPKERVLTGRAAAMIKESICRFTTVSIALERRIGGSYHWPKGAKPAEQTHEALLSGEIRR
jgi:NADH:ubiquinone reductase (H+-translocating)